MVELTKEMIDTLKKIKDAIEGSDFDIYKLELITNGLGKPVIMLDIRQLEEYSQ